MHGSDMVSCVGWLGCFNRSSGMVCGGGEVGGERQGEEVSFESLGKFNFGLFLSFRISKWKFLRGVRCLILKIKANSWLMCGFDSFVAI